MLKNPIIKQTIHIRRHGGETHSSLIIELETEHGIDLFAAIKAACIEYCNTPDGKRFYRKKNHHTFNYGDFSNKVPNTICEKHGFRITSCATLRDEDEEDYDTRLVTDEDIID